MGCAIGDLFQKETLIRRYFEQGGNGGALATSNSIVVSVQPLLWCVNTSSFVVLNGKINCGLGLNLSFIFGSYRRDSNLFRFVFFRSVSYETGLCMGNGPAGCLVFPLGTFFLNFWQRKTLVFVGDFLDFLAFYYNSVCFCLQLKKESKMGCRRLIWHSIKSTFYKSQKQSNILYQWSPPICNTNNSDLLWASLCWFFSPFHCTRAGTRRQEIETEVLFYFHSIILVLNLYRKDECTGEETTNKLPVLAGV